MKTKQLLPAALALVCVTFAGVSWLATGTVRAQSGITYVSQSPSAPYHTFKYPTGLAVSPSANSSLDIYVADTGNNVIRLWNSLSGGTPGVLAGNGTKGYVNGSLSSAEFDSPTGLWGGTYSWVYQYGCGRGKCTITYYYTKLYVNDTGNHVIRLICSGAVPSGMCTSGTVTTVAGNGTDGFVNGSSLSAEYGALAGDRNQSGSQWYVFDTQNNAIRSWNSTAVGTYAGTGQPVFLNGVLSSAEFNEPTSAAWDGGSNMYVADMANAIRKIDTSGNVTTLAGSGVRGYADGNGGGAEFDLPTGVAFNPSDGHLYVADSGNNMIRRVSTAGNVTTYAGARAGGHVDACGTQARFATPTEEVILSGKMYVSDTMNNDIRVIDLSNRCVSTYVH